MTHSSDFLQTTEDPSVKIRHTRNRHLRWFFIVVGIMVSIWFIVVAITGFYVSTILLDVRSQISQMSETAELLQFEESKVILVGIQKDLHKANQLLPIIQSSSWLPFVGDIVDSFSQVIMSSDQISMTFSPLIDLGEELIRLSGLSNEYLEEVKNGLAPEVTFDDLSTETKRTILTRLSYAADDLELLIAQIDILQDELHLISQSPYVGAITPLLSPLIDHLEQIEEPVRFLAIAAHLLPKMAGLESETSTLVLFLNNDELRPGGGFIGSYGVMKLFGGDITQFETADVYALDRLAEPFVTRAAPQALAIYNETPFWYFRDSNWSPDFSESAKQSVELFLEEGGVIEDTSSIPYIDHIDNVIAFTPTFTAELLKITGDITVSGQTFTPENVAQLLEYQVQYGFAQEGIPQTQRKEILADLIQEMKTRLYRLPAARWSEVLEASKLALQQKQFLLYSEHEEVQEILEHVDWAGRVSYNSTDALMVVDANLASLKSDPVVKREITYELFRNTSNQWVGRVSIHYDHTGGFSWNTTRYRTYTRVFLPMGTEFLRAEGHWLNDKTQNPTGAKGEVDIVEDLNMISFGAFTSIEPGEQNQLVFEFVLAPDVVSELEKGRYDLTVIKQAGAQNNPLTLNLDFDKNVTQASPPEDSNEWGDDIYRLNTILNQDVLVSTSF